MNTLETFREILNMPFSPERGHHLKELTKLLKKRHRAGDPEVVRIYVMNPLEMTEMFVPLGTTFEDMKRFNPRYPPICNALPDAPDAKDLIVESIYRHHLCEGYSTCMSHVVSMERCELQARYLISCEYVDFKTYWIAHEADMPKGIMDHLWSKLTPNDQLTVAAKKDDPTLIHDVTVTNPILSTLIKDRAIKCLRHLLPDYIEFSAEYSVLASALITEDPEIVSCIMNACSARTFAECLKDDLRKIVDLVPHKRSRLIALSDAIIPLNPIHVDLFAELFSDSDRENKIQAICNRDKSSAWKHVFHLVPSLQQRPDDADKDIETLDDIPDHQLVTVCKDGHTRCFSRSFLLKHFGKGNNRNPFTNEPFSRYELLQMLKQGVYIESEWLR